MSRFGIDVYNYESAVEKLDEVSTNLERLEENVTFELSFSLEELRKVYNMTPANEIYMRSYFKRVLKDLERINKEVQEKGFY